MSRNKPPQINLGIQGVKSGGRQTEPEPSRRRQEVPDDYYPEGIDPEEFDAMVQAEMERLELEARSRLSGAAPDDDYYEEPAPRYSAAPVDRGLPNPPAVRGSDPRADKRSQQQEYARQLQADADLRSRAPADRSDSRGGNQSAGSAKRPIVQEERRRKEALNAADYDVFGNSSSAQLKPSGSSRQPTDDQLAKLEKQKEYARLLEADRRNKEMNAVKAVEDEISPKKKPSARRPQPEDDGVYTGLNIGADSDKAAAREAKRRSQQEYADQLREASSRPPVIPSPRLEQKRRAQDGDSSHTSIQLSGYDVNTTQRIRNKKIQQEEYSNDIFSAARQPAVVSQYEQSKQRLADPDRYGTSIPLSGNDVSTVDARQRKISEQRKYNRELQEAEQSHRRAAAAAEEESSAPRRVLSGRRRAEEPDMEHPLGGGGLLAIGLSDSTADARNRKKEAQEQYARQLAADSTSNSRYRDDDEEPSRRPAVNSAVGVDGYYADEMTEEELLWAERKGIPVKRTRGSGAAVQGTQYRRDEEVLEQFKPVVVSSRVRDYKERQAAYAQLLNEDTAARDSARADSGLDDQTTRAAQQQKRAASTGRYRSGRNEVDYGNNTGTGLMIGGMDVSTSMRKENKRVAQQQYANDIANAASKPEIPQSYRSVYREQHEYEGNGLPGGRQKKFNEHSGASYHNIQQPSNERVGSGREDVRAVPRDSYRTRGTSSGGGNSQIAF
jgi:hypothetical protein